ncbi:MAG: hypothetical protein LBL86_03190 [Coriobacteriales bacterium]|jgi:hypothetical protein|nr:hypothetical protein [Coriobacteriales bacterium]
MANIWLRWDNISTDDFFSELIIPLLRSLGEHNLYANLKPTLNRIYENEGNLVYALFPGGTLSFVFAVGPIRNTITGDIDDSKWLMAAIGDVSDSMGISSEDTDNALHDYHSKLLECASPVSGVKITTGGSSGQSAPITQLCFESSYEPHVVLTKWWEAFGFGQGLELPDAQGDGGASTGGGYEGDLWINMEVWNEDDSKGSIVRLSVRPEPFGEVSVRNTLQQLIEKMRPPMRRSLSPIALAADSFTWIGGHDWVDDEVPQNKWTIAQVNEAIAHAPSGLIAADGTLIGDGSKNCSLGFIDAPRRTAYFVYGYLGLNRDEPSIEIIDGCGRVPISSIQGIRLMAHGICPYCVNISTDGKALAMIEYCDDRGYISLIDVASEDIRRLASFDHAYGDERIAFSPDNRWLLLPRTHHGHGATIIEVQTGAHRVFDVCGSGVCWWVNDGSLGLLSFGRLNADTNEYDPYQAVFLDFATGKSEALVKLSVSDDMMFRSYGGVRDSEPSCDKRCLVGMNLPSVRQDYDVDGAAMIIDIQTGEVSLTIDRIADPDRQVFRKQSHWHWNSPYNLVIVKEPLVLKNGFTPADTSEWHQCEKELGGILCIDFDSPFFG